MTYIGIDPGKSGAIAALNDNGELDCGQEPQRNDATESDIADFIAVCAACSKFAFIERVAARPGQGVSSSFKFGQSYGFLRGLLIANGIPFEEVTPQKWQSAMGCLSKGDKNVTKARAQQLFPQLKITHANADAILIAEYCRRVRTGMITRKETA